MAISINTNWSGFQQGFVSGSVTSHNYTISAPTVGRIMVLCPFTQSASGWAFNGQSFTKFGSSEIWYILDANLPSSAGTYSLTHPSGNQAAGYVILDGVDQSNPLGLTLETTDNTSPEISRLNTSIATDGSAKICMAICAVLSVAGLTDAGYTDTMTSGYNVNWKKTGGSNTRVGAFYNLGIGSNNNFDGGVQETSSFNITMTGDWVEIISDPNTIDVDTKALSLTTNDAVGPVVSKSLGGFARTVEWLTGQASTTDATSVWVQRQGSTDMFIACGGYPHPSTQSPTLNGVTGTQVVPDEGDFTTFSANYTIWYWLAANLPSNSGTYELDWSSQANPSAFSYTTFAGVDQATPIDYARGEWMDGTTTDNFTRTQPATRVTIAHHIRLGVPSATPSISGETFYEHANATSSNDWNITTWDEFTSVPQQFSDLATSFNATLTANSFDYAEWVVINGSPAEIISVDAVVFALTRNAAGVNDIEDVDAASFSLSQQAPSIDESIIPDTQSFALTTNEAEVGKVNVDTYAFGGIVTNDVDFTVTVDVDAASFALTTYEADADVAVPVGLYTFNFDASYDIEIVAGEFIVIDAAGFSLSANQPYVNDIVGVDTLSITINTEDAFPVVYPRTLYVQLEQTNFDQNTGGGAINNTVTSTQSSITLTQQFEAELPAPTTVEWIAT